MTPCISWPADRFYWALFDVPGVDHTGELPAGLLPMLGEDAPVDPDGLHAICVPLSGGRLVVCAMEKSELAEIPPEALALNPCSLPTFIESPGITSDRFNFLVGSFEPRPLRIARIRHHAFAAAVVVLCGVLIAVGLHRRAIRWDERADSARAAAVCLAESICPGGQSEDLATEAERLRGTSEAYAATDPPSDASLTLAAVLLAWPANVPSKPQSISVGHSGVWISVSIEKDAASFINAFLPPPGWTLDEPRLNTADTVSRLALQLRPAGGTQ